MKKSKVFLFSMLSFLTAIPSVGFAQLSQPFAINSAHIKRAASQTVNGAELWVNVHNYPGKDGDFDATLSAIEPSRPEVLHTLSRGMYDFSCGGSLSKGIWYGVDLFTWPSYDLCMNYLFAVNTNPFPATNPIGTAMDNKDMRLMAVETASTYDGEVYGEWVKNDMQSLEIARVDFVERQRYPIGNARRRYVAMGITHAKQLYGIGTDGNLYRVSLTNGSDQLVGPTGVTVEFNGRRYDQTGEIDPNTDTFYWLGTDATTGVAALYTVDLQTGAAQLIHEYGKGYTFYGMVIRPFEASDGAPKPVSDLAVDFPDGNTTGTVSFTMPTQTMGGQTISEQLRYTIKAAGTTLKTGSADPGSQVSASVKVQTGSQKFEVYVRDNANQQSPTLNIYQFIGFDQPKAVQNLHLTIDHQTGQATLTWDKPLGGQHGGYMGELKYQIYRIVNGVGQLLRTQSETTFTETLPSKAVARYSYLVVALNGTERGIQTESEQILYGVANTTPYFEGFQTADWKNTYTIINNNNDGYSWEWIEQAPGNTQTSYVRVETQSPADDWLVTAPITLEGGRRYQFSFSCASQSSFYPEVFEVMMGMGNTVKDLTQTVLPRQYAKNTSFETYSAEVEAGEAGEYYFGIHAVTQSGWFFRIDSVRVEPLAADSDPASGTLTVTPGERGQLKATVTYTVPTKTIGGQALGKVERVEVVRDGEILKTFSDVTPGQEISFEDLTVENGTHTYQAYTFGEGDRRGDKAEVAHVFVGVDVPVEVNNLQLLDGGPDNLHFTWDKATNVGAHGGYTNPDETDYHIMSTTNLQGYYLPNEVLFTVKGQNFADYKYGADEGDMQLLHLAVQAQNTAGKTFGVVTQRVVGKPYTLPFLETFANLQQRYYWAMSRTSDKVELSWSQQSSDGDGTSIAVTSKAGNETGQIHTGKISLAGTQSPMFTFDVRSTVFNSPIQVIVTRVDDTEETLTLAAPSTDFQTFSVDLSPYRNERYIRMRIVCNFIASGEFDIDHLAVEDHPEFNLKVASITAPDRVKSGEKATLNIDVQNSGQNPIQNYSLKVSVGDNVVFDTAVNEPIAPNAHAAFTVDYVPDLFETSGLKTITATVSCANDMNPEDNTLTAQIAVDASQLSSPETVVAEGTSLVNISWTFPDIPQELLTEDFESYTPWSIDKFGSWTTYDGDGVNSGNIFREIAYDHQGEPFAWIMWNPDAWNAAVGAQFPSTRPISGNQCAGAIWSEDPTLHLAVTTPLWMPTTTSSRRCSLVQHRQSRSMHSRHSPMRRTSKSWLRLQATTCWTSTSHQ